MRFSVGVGAFLGGLFSVLILMLVFRAFDGDAVILFGTADGKSIDILSGIVLPLVSTFAGAAAGSFFTYKFQIKNQRVEQENRDVALIRQAFLALQSQLFDLGGLKKAIVIPLASQKLRFLDMPSVLGHTGVTDRVNQDVSQPLIRHNSVEVLQKVIMAEMSYFNVIAIHRSYEALSATYKQALRNGGVGLNDICSFKFKVSKVGGEVVAQLYVTGEGLIELLDSAIVDIAEVLDELSAFYTKHYKSAENRMLVSNPIESAEDVFEKTIPPFFCDLNEMMDASGYEPRYFDPATNDPKPLRRLAKSDWRDCGYKVR